MQELLLFDATITPHSSEAKIGTFSRCAKTGMVQIGIERTG